MIVINRAQAEAEEFTRYDVLDLIDALDAETAKVKSLDETVKLYHQSNVTYFLALQRTRAILAEVEAQLAEVKHGE